ncbi:MAG: GNAT family N-acetyltransferase [bacterium]|nr:GNAT family N-acetyltransferase [bacterium]
MRVTIEDINPDNEYYISACTHVNETNETDESAARRLVWLKNTHENGVRAKAASINGETAGFVYVMPIEVCPWGPLGKDLAVVPCMFVPNDFTGKGVGEALLTAAEEEARKQGKKGLAIQAYFGDFWFMPAPYFEKRGYAFADGSKKDGGFAVLWKQFDDDAEPPRLLKPDYSFEPVEGKVVVDLFYNTFCLTSDTEAQRVREVAAEFGDSVILNEYPADDPEVLRRYQLPRGIYVNGEWIFWGYDAPREGIREAIEKALSGG